jgi:Na+-transporting NADH:ubiquinone oxidoreductase subunit C
MHSNKYIFIYSAIMVVVVAVALTIVAVQLKPLQDKNIRIEKMQNILASVNQVTTPQNAQDFYTKYVRETLVVNEKGEVVKGADAFSIDLALELKKPPAERQLPVYIATLDNGEKAYIVPLRGKGLWGAIWGYISFKSDFNTVVGTMFDHKSETPGLGAEINTREFQQHFEGKKIFDDKGIFTSIGVLKGGAKAGDMHGVDAISGGTITSKGVEKMLRDCLGGYENYFKNPNKL